MPIPWKTAAGIQAVSPDTRLYAERMVFLEGEIHAESAREFVKAILLLNQESRDAIHVFIHSPGGEVKAGLLVYDALQGSPAPCKLYCVGEAHSMAAILFASGRHGRYLYRTVKCCCTSRCWAAILRAMLLRFSRSRKICLP